MWKVYMVQCSDGTLYTGITQDVDRRVREHNTDNTAGSKYARARRPVKVVYTEDSSDRSTASRRESEIKKLTRNEKLRLIRPHTI